MVEQLAALPGVPISQNLEPLPGVPISKQGGEYTELSNAPDVVDEKQFYKAPPPVEPPGFLKAIEMIGTGAAKGSLEYTARLLSSVEKGLRGGNEPSIVPRAYEYWSEKTKEQQDKYVGASAYQGIGSVPAALLTTAPIGGAFGAVGKLASAAGKAAPYGLKTAAEYGTSATGGAGLLAALESQRYNPEHPTEPFSAEQAQEALRNPLSYVLPMAGTKLAKWSEKATELQRMKEIFPKIRAQDLKEPGPGLSLVQILTNSVSNITGHGKGAQLIHGIGEDLSNYINKLSGNIAAKYSKDYRIVAGQEFQKALQNLKKGKDELWNKLPKNQKVSDTQTIKDDIISVVDDIKSNTPLDPRHLKMFENMLKKPSFTIDEVKNIQSKIGDFRHTLTKHPEAALMRGTPDNPGVLDRLKLTQDKLIDTMKANLSDEGQVALEAARKYTQNYHATLDESNKIKDALYAEIAAKNVIKSMIGKTEAFNKAKTLGAMTETGQRATWADAVATALETSVKKDGYVDIGVFLNKIGQQSQLPELMGTETYKAFSGLEKYLRNIQASGQHKVSGHLAVAGALTGAGATVLSGVGALPVAAVIVGYNALASIANRSPLKTIFGYLGDKTKKISPTVYDYLSKKAESLLVRGEYFVNEEGALDKKEKE